MKTAASHASANTNVSGSRTDIIVLRDATLDKYMIYAFSFLSFMNIRKPKCDDPSLFIQNNKSEKTITSTEPWSRFLSFILRFRYYFSCFGSLLFLKSSS